MARGIWECGWEVGEPRLSSLLLWGSIQWAKIHRSLLVSYFGSHLGY